MEQPGCSAARLRPAIFPELAAAGSLAASALGETGQARAHQILQAAELEAQALVEAARQRAESLEQEGYRDGMLQGQAEAQAVARGRIAHLLAALEDAARRMRTLEEEFHARATESIAGLALAVAERILRAEATQDPEVTLRMVRAALSVLLHQGTDRGEVAVRVHPDQYATLRECRGELLAATEEALPLRFVADPGIELGGAVVETAGCLVDATFTGQLEEARRRLREAPQ